MFTVYDLKYAQISPRHYLILIGQMTKILILNKEGQMKFYDFVLHETILRNLLDYEILQNIVDKPLLKQCHFVKSFELSKYCRINFLNYCADTPRRVFITYLNERNYLR